MLCEFLWQPFAVGNFFWFGKTARNSSLCSISWVDLMAVCAGLSVFSSKFFQKGAGYENGVVLSAIFEQATKYLFTKHKVIVNLVEHHMKTKLILCLLQGGNAMVTSSYVGGQRSCRFRYLMARIVLVSGVFW